MQLAAIVIALVISVVGFALLGRAAVYIYQYARLGQPVPGRTGPAGKRLANMLTEILGHTRMLKWGIVGAAHWFVMVGFGALVLTLVTAYGQLFDAEFAIPFIGHWVVWNVVEEVLGFMTVLAILVLIGIRQASHPRLAGRKSRFAGSTFWQAYFVEGVVLGVGICIMLLRGLEGALRGIDSWDAHYLVSYPLIKAFDGLSVDTLETLVYTVALVKIVISMAWATTIGVNPSMGVAWHRFTAFFNIYFKREASGDVALGALQPMTSGGQPIDFEDPKDDDIFGVGQVEHFSWKGLLDFATCTECGRCQSQCPAWNTGKPLSPKLLIM
ncbi:MAG: Fe-S oxidoreductase, partial [Kribbellaceae bacterium]|nr:Fe-S oxidoreductase [Kribbellaceae bacterium]